MIYSDDYQNVQKLFDELTPYDKVLFLKKNMCLYIDDEEDELLSKEDIEMISKEIGMIYTYELTIGELLECLRFKKDSLKEKHINVLKNIISNYK